MYYYTMGCRAAGVELSDVFSDVFSGVSMRIDRLVKVAVVLWAAAVPAWCGLEDIIDRGGVGGSVGVLFSGNDPFQKLKDRSIGPVFSFGAHGDLILAIDLPGELHLVPSVDLWFKTTDFSGIKEQFNDIGIYLLQARYFFSQKESGFAPFLGVGLPFYIVNRTTYNSLDQVATEQRGSWFGFSLAGGGEFRVAEKVAPFVEVKVRLGNLSSIGLRGGVTILFY